MIPGLEGTIIAEKSGRIGYKFKSLIDSKDTQKHEEQHAMKRVFGNMVDEAEASFRLKHEQTNEEKELTLQIYLRHIRQENAEERARDEIMAYFTSEYTDAKSIFKTLTTPESKKGLYDYLASTKRSLKKQFAEKFDESLQPLANSTLERVFETEYKKLLKDSIDAFARLKKSSYSTDEAIAVLIHEPLSRWVKVVNRLTKK